MAERRNTGDRRIIDRRRSLRSPIDCQIRLMSAGAPASIVQGNLLDVSASGLRLVLSQSIAVGEKLLVEARRDSRVLCNVTVQVVWTEPESAGQQVIGCHSLTELSLRQLNQLKSVVADAAAIATD